MRPLLDHFPPPSFPQPSLGNRQHTATSENYQAQTKGVSIALTTKEGDTITISQQSASSQYRKESNAINSSHLIEQRVRLDGMTMSVQGDLSQQELDDLTELMSDLSAIANDFFNGNMENALTGAMSIGDMGSISQLDATFTRTSILANYLEGPHPVPSLPRDANSTLVFQPFEKNITDDFFKDAEPRMIDIMTAQWQQFIDSIKSNHEDTSPPKNHSPISQNMVAKDMLERAKETVTNHPRLTPLLPSVVDLALKQTASQYLPRESSELLVKSTSTAFNSLFADWVV